MSTVPDILLQGIDGSRVTDPMIRAAETVYAAVASSGMGEAWSTTDTGLPDAVRVGNWLVTVETDDDEHRPPAGLGWLLTVHAVDRGEAVPVTGYVEDTGPAARRRLVKLIREAGRPLVWRRVSPGLYRAGDYVVGHIEATSEWYGEGPHLDQCFDTKAEAQAACERARA